jgi:hypothetical protein
MKYFVLVLFFSCTGVYSNAQEQAQKIGHADWGFIFSQLPEYKTIK